MSEWHEQRDIIAWFKAYYPKHARSIRVSMNGLNFGGGRKAAIMISQMRAQGMVEGESDIAILIPTDEYGCLVLEHKASDSAHKLTPEQADYLEYHESIGNCAVSTRGTEAAKAAIKTYMDKRVSNSLKMVQ